MKKEVSIRGSFLLLAAAIPLVAGCFAFAGAMSDFKNAKSSPAWPTVEGRVTVSKYKYWRKQDADLNIRYQYSVAGRIYEGDNYRFGDTLEDVASISARYPVGRAVSVHVQPDKPQVSVLEPGVDGNHYFAFGLSILFLLVGVGVTIFGFRRLGGRA